MDVNRLIQQNKAIHGAGPRRIVDTSGLFGSIEGFFRALNLNTPVMRSLFVAGVATGALHLIKPSLMFQDGRARPWEPLTSAEEAQAVAPTMLTWWMAAAGAGFAVGLFI